MPPVFNDFSVVVKAGTFEWPASERKPSGFSDIKTAEKLVMLQVDDVWRLAEMTILLGIGLPWTRALTLSGRGELRVRCEYLDGFLLH